MSKKCKICGILNQNPLLKYCKDCYYETNGSYGTLNPISKKKKDRIKTHGSETEFFIKVWESRPHECEKCGRELHTPKPHNFDHKDAKGMNEDKRYDPENIQILCFAHHFEKQTGLKYKGIDLDL